MKVYFFLDEKSVAVKIGKSNDIQGRLDDLKTGNPNTLKVIHHINCKSEEHSFEVEKELHKKYQHLHIQGEWFRYEPEEFKDLIDLNYRFETKEKRTSISYGTLYGEEEFGIHKFPDCYFYTNHKAQILDSYENVVGKNKLKWRTMEWPTYGEQKLLPYSTETDRVFISDKRHKQNIEQKNFQDGKKKDKPNNLVDFL
jgi:hypothetical protein